jgi:paraquat-inducible protein B
MMDQLVARGLRARLASTSLVTGVMYVSFDEAPGTPMHRSELPGKGAIPEIPTLPTQLDELTQSLTDAVAKITDADIQGVSNAISAAMGAVGRLATSDDLRNAIGELPGTIRSARRLTRTLDAGASRAGDVVEDAQRALAAFRETLTDAHGIVSPNAPLPVDLGAAVANVDKAAVSVRQLADFLRRNPHAIVAGTKPREATP